VPRTQTHRRRRRPGRRRAGALGERCERGAHVSAEYSSGVFGGTAATAPEQPPRRRRGPSSCSRGFVMTSNLWKSSEVCFDNFCFASLQFRQKTTPTTTSSRTTCACCATKEVRAKESAWRCAAAAAAAAQGMGGGKKLSFSIQKRTCFPVVFPPILFPCFCLGTVSA
jgi:hypothetical protein